MAGNQSTGNIKRFIYAVVSLTVTFIAGALKTSAHDTSTTIFHPDFRTLQVTVNDNFFAPNAIILDSDDLLTVEFDELADDRRYLRAKLIHCNADWQPSPIPDSDFVTGFNEMTIDDAEFSKATITPYVHYRLTIPNEQIQIKISGNYLLKIYDEEDPGTTLLQVRFYVSEANALISGTISPATDIDYKKQHQQLTLSVDCSKSPVNNIYNDLKIYVTQNNRTDNEVMITSPMRVSGNNAFYEHLRELIFPAGNEYRRFETVSTYFPGLNVNTINYAEPFYHFDLVTDYPRSTTQYIYDKTQNGRFLIRQQNANDSHTEADYIVVHFTLDAPHLYGTDIYLDGDFVNRRLDSTSRMNYNPEHACYEKTMLLKQGSYNYQYITSKSGSSRSATADIDGDFYQTINEYQIRVYTRVPGERYDRLIGYSTIYSTN